MRHWASIILFFSIAWSHAETIVVGTPPYSPPFVIANGNNHFSGFDIDLLTEICRRLNAQCQYKSMSYAGIFSALLNGHIDIAIGGVTITPERETQFLFSLPYLSSYAQFLTNQTSSIQTLANIHGKAVGLGYATVFQSLVLAKFGSSINIKTYDFLSEMLSALSSGEVDVLLLDRATAETWYANSNNTYRLVGNRIPQGLGYGILSTKEHYPLITAINKALLAMESDGTYLKIYSTYFTGSEF
jgi:arginine transport system substrate-binding protein